MITLTADVLVIGGGATGAGVAWDASLRGLDVILVDRGDLAAGTSGRFHGLLHSGARYVVRDPPAAVECIGENRILKRVAADCVEDTGGLFVTTPWDDPEYAERFVRGCRSSEVDCEEISVGRALHEEPLLNPSISRAFVVPDANIDVWKTVWSLARGAQRLGARVLPYHEVTGIRREGDAITGATVHDIRGAEEVTIEARVTINASGAWAGRIAALAGVENVGVLPSRGIMIAMNHRLVNTVVNRCQMPSDGDIIVPIRTVSVIGTTEQPTDDPDDQTIPQSEVDLMLDEGEKLVPGFRQARALRAWSGVRPLFRETGAAPADDAREMSRTHALLDHRERDGVHGFLTITGGKLTTFRLMAEQTVDAVCLSLGVERPCPTATEPLPGSERGENYHLGERLWRKEAHLRSAQVICECELVSREQLKDAIGRTGSSSLDDIRRRLRLGMGPCQGGFCIYRAAGVMHSLGGLDAKEANASLLSFLQERWKGVWPVLHGDQLRQMRLDEWIFHGVLNVGRGPVEPVRERPTGDAPGAARMAAPVGGAEAADAGSDSAPAGHAGSGNAPGASRRRHYDVVVIGAGTAGLTAAVRLAQQGAEVCLLAKGLGSTHLATGAIDVLGYSPELVTAPSHALTELGSRDPGHPYGRIGVDVVARAVDWLISTAAAGPLPGYTYTGNIERNFMLPTAVGAVKPSAVVPETFAAGEVSSLGALAVVGVPNMRDFHDGLCASNLRAAGVDARDVSIDVQLQRADASTLTLAGLFDDPSWRAAFAARLAPLVGDADHVALPAMLGLRDPHAVLNDLQDRLGAPVFEIPTVPPSVPGMRLFEILRHALRAAGGRLVLGAGVIDHTRSSERIVSIDAATPGSRTTYSATSFVLATGGFHSGAITLDSRRQAHETVLGLPLSGTPPEGSPRFLPSYLDEQPIARAGVMVHDDLHAAGAANVVVAGASLPGAVPWREASGEGIALGSGYRAAQVVAADLGVAARASRHRALA